MASCSRNQGHSSESSSEDQEDSNAKATSRKKRDLPHSVFAQALTSTRIQSGNSGLNFDSLIFGNPDYGSLIRLYCRTRWYLVISPYAKVYGVQDNDTTYGMFRVSSAGQAGHVHILGVEAKLYLALNPKGIPYGEADNSKEETVWIEELFGQYNTYLSRKYAHLGWYLGLKKSGNGKSGSLTGWGQKSIQFLPKRVEK